MPTVSRGFAQLSPAFARCEARPKTLREIGELGDHVRDAARTRIAHRAARERSEARAEDDAGAYSYHLGLVGYADVASTPLKISATCSATSRPTRSASSTGPIGMPNPVAAASILSSVWPSACAYNASSM